MVDIQAAIVGLKYIRDFTKWVGEMRQDAEILSRVNEAMRFAGDVQDKLQELREENLRLTEERRQLADQLREADDWQKRRSAYQLAQTPGGALVLKSEGPPGHYACPNCAESKRELQILQDRRVSAGFYDCRACQAFFHVDTPKPRPDPNRNYRRPF